jgi:hypothetical protein
LASSGDLITDRIARNEASYLAAIRKITTQPIRYEMTAKYNVPSDAATGIPETLYPEYRKKLKQAGQGQIVSVAKLCKLFRERRCSIVGAVCDRALFVANSAFSRIVATDARS